MLRALLPMIDSVANLLIETSPGWWTSRHNVSRAEGASLYESLFTQQGFVLGYTSKLQGQIAAQRSCN